jgi:uncharacterized protein YvpB
MNNRLVLLFVLLTLHALGSPARADDLPDSAYISGVVGHAQAYMLSCESRSAADWAAYFGVRFSEAEFLNALPRSDNPERGFVGRAADAWGYLPPNSYGVHADPVADLLQEYGLAADGRVGMGWDDLRAEIAAERPVIVWVIGQMWSGTPVEYEASDGSTVTVARFEHTMILIGYSPQTVQVVDPASGLTGTYSLGSFLASWGVLGNMGVVLEEDCCDEAVSDLPPAPTPLPPPVIDAPFVLRLPLVYRASPVSPQLIAEDVQSEALPDSYTVQAGDTLIAVGRSLGVDWRVIAALNNLNYPFVVFPGQILSLP